MKKKNSIILDSGYGSYLKGGKPKAIANEFLYHNPSLLFWTDELVCDSNALEEEATWAKEGFLVSELSVKLKQEGIIKVEDFSNTFKNKTNELLIKESNQDDNLPSNQKLQHYLVPDIESENLKDRNKFYDINALLFLSAKMGIPYINTKPAENHLNWKIEKWNEDLYGSSNLKTRKEVISFESIFDIKVPNLELFPKTELYYKAEAIKEKMLTASQLFEKGEVNKSYVEKMYNDFHKAYKKYDQSVKSEVLDNFSLILQIRNDNRLSKLRTFMETFSSRIQLDNYHQIEREIKLKLERELLEIESEIAENSNEVEWIDNYNTKLSFPIELLTTIGGLTLGVLNQNPIFIALAMSPSFVTWINHHKKSIGERKYLWQSYLHDSKEKFEKQQRLFEIDKKLKRIRKS